MEEKRPTREEVVEIYRRPLLALIFEAASLHRKHHRVGEIQLCRLLSIKTGGCSEDCAYCPQSARYQSGVQPQKMLESEEILEAARRAKREGNSRFCMGAAWRRVRDGGDFERLLKLVSEIRSMDLEVCCTLGMLTEEQAAKLGQAGVYAYNHNLDTGPDYYPSVISTRSYQERLETLKRAGEAGMTLCCGGILGMGESEEDRIDLLFQLANLEKLPESVPINTLIPVEGTPLEKRPPVPFWELVRMVAAARVLLPEAMIRLSAGRRRLSDVEQTLCFLAGANSIHTGERLLTAENAEPSDDRRLMDLLGLVPKESRALEQKSF